MKRLTKKRLKNILFGFTGTAIHCPFCKSMNVRINTESDIVRNERLWDEQYGMRCEDCGADAIMQEVWIEPKEDIKGEK